MVHQKAPDSSRSIRRFRRARRSLEATGGRRQRAAAPADGPVVVVSAPRRTHREEDAGPARWPADGWSLGSELAPVASVEWTAPLPVAASEPPAAPPRTNEPHIAVKPHFAAQAPIPRIPPARPAPRKEPRRERATVLASTTPAPSPIRERRDADQPVSRAEAIRAELRRDEAGRAEAIHAEAIRAEAIRAEAVRAQVQQPGRPGPAHHSARRATPAPRAATPRPAAPKPAAPKPAAPKPRREVNFDERPRHAAVSGGRRPRHVEPDARWRVVDLSAPATEPEPEVVLASVARGPVARPVPPNMVRLDSLRPLGASTTTAPRRVGGTSYPRDAGHRR